VNPTDEKHQTEILDILFAIGGQVGKSSPTFLKVNQKFTGADTMLFLGPSVDVKQHVPVLCAGTDPAAQPAETTVLTFPWPELLA
jgi:hypothetical protein